VKRILYLFLTSLCYMSSTYGQQIEPLPNFTCSVLDDAGMLWFGSSNDGLWKLEGNTPFRYGIPGHESAFEFYSMTLDRQGNLWVGSRDCVFEFDYNAWKFIDLNEQFGGVASANKRNRLVHGISVNHLGHVLMGVEDLTLGQSLLMRSSGESNVDFIKPFDANEVFEDLSAHIWMAGGAYRMEEGRLVHRVSIPSGSIQCAIEDSRGEVWVGTEGEGVYRFDGESFRHYGIDHGFEHLSVTCLHEDEKGRIWMGTKSLDGLVNKGVSYFEMGTFHHLQAAHDCPVRSVNAIASDKRGNVWFAGDAGELVRFNGRNFSIINVSGMQD
jgi:ligand-binding sensor domain-containing protein